MHYERKSSALLSLVVAALLVPGVSILAKSGDSMRALPFPSEAQSTDALSRGISALYQKDGKLLALPEGKGFVMVSSFDPKGDRKSVV